MKVAWIVRQAEGGMLVHLRQLLMGMKDQYDILIAGPRNLETIAKDGAKYFPVEINDGILPGKDLKAIWQLTKIFKHECPDIIHLHGLKTLVVGVPAAKIARKGKLLFTAHNCLPKRNPGRMSALHTRIQKRLFNSLDLIIAVSDFVKKEITEYTSSYKVRTIHNGVDCSKFEGFNRAEARVQSHAVSGELVVGTVARLFLGKGIDTLLQAASLVVKVLPNIRFVIVGDGPERDKYKAYSKALGIDNKVEFLGFRNDVPQLMAGWDVFALPTHSEGFSLSVLEAMASRLPVVVSDVPSLREMVVPGRSGYLVQPKDSPGFARAIITLLKDLPRSRAMGEANLRRVRQYFGTDQMLKNTIKAYCDLVREDSFYDF